MSVFLPTTTDEAVRLLAEYPGAQVLAGGTDYMVQVNYGQRTPQSVVSLRALDELRNWHCEGETLVLGAGLRYIDLMSPELAALAPALAQAARTVGSPQIRATGTLGGNIATASPAGDTLPVLAALDAQIDVVGPRARRSVALSDLVIGVKRTTLASDELIVSISIPVAAGPQEFLKIGKRNAMVIAVSSVALIVSFRDHRVACALGSVGPTVIRCTEAERFAASAIDWDRRVVSDSADYVTFAALCADAAQPIDDHRATADYRQHSIATMAKRALMRAL